MVPNDCKYTKDHEWIREDGGIYRVGITDYAAEQLGDVTYVELPQPGATVGQGDECATVESVKAASDIFAPAGGTVKDVNLALNDNPELVNQAPFGDGWFFTLENVDESQLATLMDGPAYDAYIASLDH